MAGQTVTVELLSRAATSGGAGKDDSAGKLEGTEQVTLGGDGEVVPVKFELTPAEVGRRTLRLRVKPPRAGPQRRRQPAGSRRRDRRPQEPRAAVGRRADARVPVPPQSAVAATRTIVVDVLLQIGQRGHLAGRQQDPRRVPRHARGNVRVRLHRGLRSRLAALDRRAGRPAGELGGRARRRADRHRRPGSTPDDAGRRTPPLAKIRNLYPVEFQRRLSLAGRRTLRLEGALAAWTSPAKGWRPTSSGWPTRRRAAAGLGRISRRVRLLPRPRRRSPAPPSTPASPIPRAAGGDQQPVYFAGQFYGSGRVFYLGSGEMWRLRAVDRSLLRAVLHQADPPRLAGPAAARLQPRRAAGRARPLPAGQHGRRAGPVDQRAARTARPAPASRCR